MLRTDLSPHLRLTAASLWLSIAGTCFGQLDDAASIEPTASESQAPSEERSILVPSLEETADESEPAEALELREPLEGPVEQGESDSVDHLAELTQLVRDSHPWARFEPGAWRRVVVVSEVFNEEGTLAGRTTNERTERLTAVDETTYTLSIESVVELGGLRTPAPAELVRLSILTDRKIDEAASLSATPGDPSSISLGETVVPCRTWTLESANETSTDSETLHVAVEEQAVSGGPRLLRRQRQVALNGEPGLSQTVGVTRLGIAAFYGEDLSETWHVTTSTTHPSGARTEAFSVHGADAPGGVFRQAFTDYGPNGKKTRWAVTQLVASGRTPAEAIGEGAGQADDPAVSVEVRPRRLLRLLRREERMNESLESE